MCCHHDGRELTKKCSHVEKGTTCGWSCSRYGSDAVSFLIPLRSLSRAQTFAAVDSQLSRNKREKREEVTATHEHIETSWEPLAAVPKLLRTVSIASACSWTIALFDEQASCHSLVAFHCVSAFSYDVNSRCIVEDRRP